MRAKYKGLLCLSSTALVCASFILVSAEDADAQVKSATPISFSPQLSQIWWTNFEDFRFESFLKQRLAATSADSCHLRGYAVPCAQDSKAKQYVFLGKVPVTPFLGLSPSQVPLLCRLADAKLSSQELYGPFVGQKKELPSDTNASMSKDVYDKCMFGYKFGLVPTSFLKNGAQLFAMWEKQWNDGIQSSCNIACPVVVKDRNSFFYCATDRLKGDEFRIPYDCGLVAKVDKKGTKSVAMYTHSDGETDIGGEDPLEGIKLECTLAKKVKLADLETVIREALAKPPIQAVNEKKETNLLPGHSFLWKRDRSDNEESGSEWSYWKSFSRSNLRPEWFDRYLIEVFITNLSEDDELIGKAYIRGVLFATRRNIEADLRLPDSSLRDAFRARLIANIQAGRKGAKCVNI
jgi:hypothetical protein